MSSSQPDDTVVAVSPAISLNIFIHFVNVAEWTPWPLLTNLVLQRGVKQMCHVWTSIIHLGRPQPAFADPSPPTSQATSHISSVNDKRPYSGHVDDMVLVNSGMNRMRATRPHCRPAPASRTGGRCRTFAWVRPWGAAVPDDRSRRTCSRGESRSPRPRWSRERATGSLCLNHITTTNHVKPGTISLVHRIWQKVI